VENYLDKRKSLKKNNNKKRHLLVFHSQGLMIKSLNLEMELVYLLIHQFLHLIKVKEYFQRIIFLVNLHLEIIKNKMYLKLPILYLELLKVFSLLILGYLLLKNKHLYLEHLNQIKLKEEEKMEKKVIVNKFN
jgi:hypothetical protein